MSVPLEIVFEETDVTGSIECGFRVEHASGDNEGHEFSLNTGAGLGSPWITFRYKGRYFRYDVRDLVTKLVAHVDATDAPKPKE